MRSDAHERRPPSSDHLTARTYGLNLCASPAPAPHPATSEESPLSPGNRAVAAPKSPTITLGASDMGGGAAEVQPVAAGSVLSFSNAALSASVQGQAGGRCSLPWRPENASRAATCSNW